VSLEVALGFCNIESVEIDRIGRGYLGKGSDMASLDMNTTNFVMLFKVRVILVNAAFSVRQPRTLKYLGTGFLVETHHVFLVRLTLQGKLFSESFLIAIERILALIKTYSHPVTFTPGFGTKIFMVSVGVGHWRCRMHCLRYCCSNRLLCVAQVSKHKMEHAGQT
jgi:hypothetical protein